MNRYFDIYKLSTFAGTGTGYNEIEEGFFKVKDEFNPDLEKYAQIDNKDYALKPVQCRVCLHVFIPEFEDERFCFNCQEKGFTMDNVQLFKCAEEGCNNYFKRLNINDKYCPSHRNKGRRNNRLLINKSAATARKLKRNKSESNKVLSSVIFK